MGPRTMPFASHINRDLKEQLIEALLLLPQSISSSDGPGDGK
jgi:hypothetical protein